MTKKYTLFVIGGILMCGGAGCASEAAPAPAPVAAPAPAALMPTPVVALPTPTVETPPPAPTVDQADGGTPVTSIFKAGDKVVARWNGGNTWWDAQVTKASGDEVFVKYTDGSSQTLPPLDVAHLHQPNSSVHVGQEVLALWNGTSYYSAFIKKITDTAVTVKWKDGSGVAELPYAAIEVPGK